MDSRQTHPLGGIILAGGQSRRMGTPKAFLRLAPDGPTVIELVLARLETVTRQAVIVTNTPDAYAYLGRVMVADEFPGLGALAGIHAGLAASRYEHNLVVACDMPFLNPTLLTSMAERPRDYDVLIPRLADGMLETLHAIYSRTCLAPIAAQLRRDDGKVNRFFAHVTVAYIDEAHLREYDPELRSFNNMNTPADFEAARRAYGTP